MERSTAPARSPGPSRRAASARGVRGSLRPRGLRPPGRIVCAYFVLDKLAIAIYIGAVVEKGGKGFRQATAAAVKAQKSAVPPLFSPLFSPLLCRCYRAVFDLELA